MGAAKKLIPAIIAAMFIFTALSLGNAQNGDGSDGAVFDRDEIFIGADASFVPVTNITGVPTTVNAGAWVTLVGTVAPTGATNKTISWSIKSAGTTGATLSGTTLSVTSPGTVTVTATITDGAFETDWKMVSAGYGHTAAITVNGELYTWGWNYYGQLGDGTKVNRSEPTRIGDATNWAMVSAGYYHTVAINTNGELYAWGDNSNGKLGTGDSTERLVPTRIGTATNWAAVSAGCRHTAAVTTTGWLYACGQNTKGQLGDNTTVDKNVMTRIGTATNWATVSAGYLHTAAVTTTGWLYAWGNNDYSQLGTGDSTERLVPTRIGTAANWAAVSAGGFHTAAVTTGKGLYTWGSNSYGQLGIGSTANKNIPTYVGPCAMVSAGYQHTAAVATDGSLVAWGDNQYGQLGDGTNTNRTSPVKMGTATNRTAVSAGGMHTAATAANGELYACGYNVYSQLGDGTTVNKNVPTKIGPTTKWAMLSAGENHTMGIRTDGTLWAWGDNQFGQLGDGSLSGKSVPTRIGTASNWVLVSAGYYHTVAINANGELFAWGSNSSGQIGDNSTVNRNAPVKIGTATNWRTVSAGSDYTVAINSNGELFAWGGNSAGQLGDGTIAAKSVPTKIGAATNWRTVSAGYSHTVAVTTGGNLFTWGSNNFGEIGNGLSGSSASVRNPTQIGTASNWKTASAGYGFTTAVTTDGWLYTWGHNNYCQLGQGDTNNRNVPTRVGTAANWSAVSAGRWHAAAVTAGGWLYTWGYNNWGQIGDGTSSTTVGKSVPTRIGTASDWAEAAPGGYHTMALTKNGTMWAWGNNANGRLGDGTTSSKTSPTMIKNTVAYKRDFNITANAWQPTITTSSLTSGITGTSYTQALAASGTQPITWTLNTGSTLPSGLTLNGSTGVISGTPTVAGTFTFTVKATNMAGSNTKTLSLTLNAPPAIITKSLPGGVVGLSYSQTLTATGSGTITWSEDAGTLPSGLTLSPAGVISGTPTVVGTFNFSVKADNTHNPAAVQPLSILISPAAVPPTITTPASLPGGTVGIPYSLTFAATGSAPITWGLDAGSNPFVPGLTMTPNGVVSGTPSADGTFTFRMRATNSADYDTKEFTITVVAPPDITTASLPDGTVGTSYSQPLAATGSAPITWSLDGGSLPPGLNIYGSGTISGTPLVSGTFAFVVRATNAAGSQTAALSIDIVPAPVPPTITTASLPSGTEGVPYTRQLTATGDETIVWSVDSGSLPSGLSMSSEGLISGTPTVYGTFTFTARATNAVAYDTKALDLVIAPAPVPPTITTSSLLSGTVGTIYSGTLTATGDATIVWMMDDGDLPEGLTLSAAGTISGMPATAGTYTFTVRATNDAGSDTKEFTVAIVPAAVPPTITTSSLPNGTVGVSYSQTLTATGDETIVWTIDDGDLPDGLSLSSAGSISGTPTAAGTFTFTAEAANGAGSDTKTFTVIIAPAPVQPTITTASLPNGTVGTIYSETLTATGDETMVWTIDDGALPGGLTLSGNVISGIPTAAGTFTFTVKAENGAGFDTKVFTVAIAPAPVPPIITTASLPNGKVGTIYSGTLTATGDTEIAWSIDDGALPGGLTLSGNVISGTPTTAGTFTFTVKAENSAGAVTKVFTVQIVADTPDPRTGGDEGGGLPIMLIVIVIIAVVAIAAVYMLFIRKR